MSGLYGVMFWFIYAMAAVVMLAAITSAILAGLVLRFGAEFLRELGDGREHLFLLQPLPDGNGIVLLVQVPYLLPEPIIGMGRYGFFFVIFLIVIRAIDASSASVLFVSAANAKSSPLRGGGFRWGTLLPISPAGGTSLFLARGSAVYSVAVRIDSIQCAAIGYIACISLAFFLHGVRGGCATEHT